MSNFTDFIGGSGGGAGRKYVDLIILDRSTTWSPRQDCKAVVTVIGGGGSGGGVESDGTVNYSAMGGGAGGLAQSDIIDLSASTSYTATVGSGGASVINTTSTGNNGGNSSFSGTGITTLTGNGGSGGATATTSIVLSGGAGGSASGGLYNYTGGAGGSKSSTWSYVATGGGAVNITGTAYNGGNVEGNYTASGGGGCGGSGANTGSTAYASSKGGKGTLFSVLDFYYLIPENYSVKTEVSGSVPFLRWNTSLTSTWMPSSPVFFGGDGVTNDYASSDSYSTLFAQSGGLFAGGGGLMPGNGSSGYANVVFKAGSGGLFGGGGGGVGTRDADAQVVSGAGGDGVLFIAVTEYL